MKVSLHFIDNIWLGYFSEVMSKFLMHHIANKDEYRHTKQYTSGLYHFNAYFPNSIEKY